MPGEVRPAQADGKPLLQAGRILGACTAIDEYPRSLCIGYLLLAIGYSWFRPCRAVDSAVAPLAGFGSCYARLGFRIGETRSRWQCPTAPCQPQAPAPA